MSPLLFLILYGVGSLGALILLGAGIFVRTRALAIMWGIVGSYLIGLQVVIVAGLFAMFGAGHLINEVLIWWVLGGIAIVAIYFRVSLSRLKD